MGDLRRHDRSVAIEALGDELTNIQTVLEETHGQRNARMADALEDMADGELVDWVAVAVHRQADGTTKTCIHGHPDRTSLQIKGLLHDAVWTAAHQD